MSGTVPFTRPPGDPESLANDARRIAQVAESARTTLAAYRATTTTALQDWSAPFGLDFARVAGAHTRSLTAAAEQTEGAAETVRAWAQTLASSQQTIDALTARWLGEQASVTAGPQGPALTNQGALHGIETEAFECLDRLRSVEARLATMLDESTEVVVPRGADMSPEQLFSQVTAVWGELGPTFQDWKRGGTAVGKLGGGANRALRGVIAVKAFTRANLSETLLNQTRNLALAQARLLISEGGRYNRVPGQLGILARDIADARRVADAAKELSVTRYGAFYKAVVPSTRFAKCLAVGGVFGGVYDLVANPLDEGGARRRVSQVVDVASIGAGSAALLGTFGFIAVTPVGAAVIAGVFVVAGVWAAGTYVYDHWDDITHGASVAKKWVSDAAGDLADDTRDLASGLAHSVGGLFA